MQCPLCQLDIGKSDLSNVYLCSKCGEFHMDFGFISQLNYVAMRYGKEIHSNIIKEIQKTIINNKVVILFIDDYTHAEFKDEKIVLELNDIATKIGLFIDDKVVPSDYGD